jgi:hypothetical protein
MLPPSICFEPLTLTVARETSYARQLDERARQEAYQFAPEPDSRMSVLITATNLFVTGIWTDCDQGELYEFVDDTGKDLLSAGGGSVSSGVSPDSRAGLFAVSGRTSPHHRAKEIYARGRIRVSTAPAVSTDKSNVIQLRSGSSADVAGFNFNVGSVEPSEYGDGELEVKLLRSAAQHQLRNVAKVYFEDPHGKRLDFRETFSSAQGVDDDYELDDNYLFRQSINELRIVVESWKDRREDDCEYRVRAGIGCGPPQTE